MAIETGPAPILARGTAVDSAATGRGKSDAATDAQAASPGGFMAVLASLAPAVAAAPKEKAAEDEKRPLSAGEPAPVLADPLAQMQVPVLVSTDAAANAPMDAGALLAQSAQWSLAPAVASAAVPSTATIPTVVTVVSGPASLAAAAVAAEAGSRSAAPDVVARPAAGAAGVANPAAAARALRSLQSAAAPLDGAAEPVISDAPKTSKGLADAAVRLAQVNANVSAPVEASAAANPRALPAVQKEPEAPMTSLAVAVALTNTGTPLRREDSMRERSASRSSPSEWSTVGQPMATGLSGSPAETATPVMGPADVYVAERVSYWISNDVQNAQMKLDGIGDKPVEVSIRMQGNEAHVAFRTDELQTRAALENASVHLKDMLQREGLVLSGVSVGMAGAGDAGDAGTQQRNKSRQEARQMAVTAAVPGATNAASVSTRSTGRSLDLFV